MDKFIGTMTYTGKDVEGIRLLRQRFLRHLESNRNYYVTTNVEVGMLIDVLDRLALLEVYRERVEAAFSSLSIDSLIGEMKEISHPEIYSKKK